MLSHLAPRVRRLTVITACVAVLASVAALAATALAVAPARNATFSGKAHEYMNNAPKWTYEGQTGRYHFKTSKNGRHILDFSGTYFYYCGSGTTAVSDQSIGVAAGGRFMSQGSTVERSGGKVTGTAYTRIWGMFTGKGKTASVSYLVDFVYAGHHVSHPYSTTMKRSTDACESWVHGAAKMK